MKKFTDIEKQVIAYKLQLEKEKQFYSIVDRLLKASGFNCVEDNEIYDIRTINDSLCRIILDDENYQTKVNIVCEAHQFCIELNHTSDEKTINDSLEQMITTILRQVTYK